MWIYPEMAQLWINGKEQDAFIKKNHFWDENAIKEIYLGKSKMTDAYRKLNEKKGSIWTHDFEMSGTRGFIKTPGFRDSFDHLTFESQITYVYKIKIPQQIPINAKIVMDFHIGKEEEDISTKGTF